MQLLLVESGYPAVSTGTEALAREFGWNVESAPNYESAYQTARKRTFDLTILPARPSGAPATEAGYDQLLKLIADRDGSALLIGSEATHHEPTSRGIVERISPDAPMAELRGRFAMIDRYHERFRRLQDEVRRMEQLGQRLNEHFREVDQEMQLAARLQKDFLPSTIDPIGNLCFATMFRPASWVSGDIFDVFRIDENHTAFYVADAVGHGVAASLLTMFIKRSFMAKRVGRNHYEVLTPSQTMGLLNNALVDQGLPNCQFVTAFYGIIDHRTLTMDFARAGHPYPVHLSHEGAFNELKSTGGLLGLFKEETFTTRQIQLRAGDKVVAFTDGVELAFQESHSKTINPSAYLDCFRSLAAHPIREMIDRIGHKLDDEMGSINPHDDITMVGVEVLPD